MNKIFKMISTKLEKHNKEEVKEIARLGAKAGIPEAMNLYVYILQKESDSQFDKKEAIKYYKKAIQKG